DDLLNPLAVIAPPPRKDDGGGPAPVYSSLTSLDGQPAAVSGSLITPLGAGSAPFILPDGTRLTTLTLVSGGTLAQLGVLLGSTTGLYRTVDGGSRWFDETASGFGLEATSKNVGAMISTLTANG